MRLALEQARQAAREGEVPIGAVVALEGRVIGRGRNLTRRLQDATAHAEALALREAARFQGHWYFDRAALYVTIEPCAMCAGMLLLSRLGRLVFGAREPKFGCCGSLYHLPADPRFNHRVEVTEGVLAEECAALMREFFQGLREGRGGGG